MTTEPLAVTIAAPVYNVEPYIEKALLSALEQDFQHPYEILIVDDCGTDGSMDIVRHLQQTHPDGSRIRIISHPENRGLGAARNTLIDNLQGRYAFFLDPDDSMEKDALSVLYAKATESNADITYGSTWKTYPSGEKVWLKNYPDYVVCHENAGAYLAQSKPFLPHVEYWAKLWRTDFIRQHKIRSVNKIIDDALPNFRALVESSTLCFTDRYVYRYLERPDSLSRANELGSSDNRVLIILSDIRAIKRLVKEQYHHIPGIFDIYLDWMSMYLHCIQRAHYSPGIASQINPTLKGYIQVIPSIRSIYSKHYRLLWFCCRNDESLERYLQVTHGFAGTLPGRALRNILNLLPCRNF